MPGTRGTDRRSSSYLEYTLSCIFSLRTNPSQFLMAIHGVETYEHLLSWLVTGMILSNLYMIPFLVTIKYSFTPDGSQAYWGNGNIFIFWLFLMCHISHLTSLGMHVYSWFNRREYNHVNDKLSCAIISLATGLFATIVLNGLYIIPLLCLSPTSDFKISSLYGLLFPCVLLDKLSKEAGILGSRCKYG